MLARCCQQVLTSTYLTVLVRSLTPLPGGTGCSSRLLLLLSAENMSWKVTGIEMTAWWHPCNADCESVPQAPQQQAQFMTTPLLGSVLCRKTGLGTNVLHCCNPAANVTCAS